MAAFMRLPGNCGVRNVGSAYKMIRWFHLFAFCLFGAMMRYVFENVRGVPFMGL